MKSLLFSILFFSGGIISQVLGADSSDCLPLPAVYLGGEDGSIVVVDPSTEKIVKTLTVENAGDINSMTSVLARKDASEDFNRYVYCATSNNEVIVIEAVTGKVIGQPIPVGNNPSALTSGVVNQCYYVYCANTDDNTITVIDTKAFLEDPTQPANAVVGTIPVGQEPVALVWPDTGRQYVFCANKKDSTVSVIDAEAFLEDPTKPGNALVGKPISEGIFDPSALTWETTRSYVYCANESDGTISLINEHNLKTDSGDKIPLGGVEDFVGPIALTSDGSFLYFVDDFDNDSVSRVSLDTPHFIYKIKNTEYVKAIDFVRVNNKGYIYFAIDDYYIQIIDTYNNTVKKIDVDFSTYALTTVYPISRKSVNNTSAHSALKNGKFGDS